MAENSKISWCDATINPWWGCAKVSPGCLNCYADSFSKRWGKDIWGKGKPRENHLESARKLAMKLQRKALKDGSQPRVFCASMADRLDDEVPIEWLADLLELIAETPNLTWLLLTKRPQNFASRTLAVSELSGRPASMLAMQWGGWGNIPPNVWIGTTVEDQTRADERIPQLLQIPAKIRFLSCEPLLEQVRLFVPLEHRPSHEKLSMLGGIHWVITGGESGPGFRPFNPEWARSLRDQCKAAGVAFHMKQMGGLSPSSMPPIPADLQIQEFPKP